MKTNINSPEISQNVHDGNKPSTKPGLRAFAEEVWIADGPEVYDMGVLFTTRMAVVKLTDGSVWIESPVPVPFDILKCIADLGPVNYLVAATPRHVWRLDGAHTLFPEAQLWTSRPTPFTLKKGHLPISGILSDTPYAAWAEDLDQVTFKGNPLLDEVLFFHRKSRTVILDDLIQANPIRKDRPLQNMLMRLEGGAFPQGGVGLDMRLTFTNRNLARHSLKKVLSWDFDKLIIAHGSCIEKDAKPYVERAFQWLMH